MKTLYLSCLLVLMISPILIRSAHQQRMDQIERTRIDQCERMLAIYKAEREAEMALLWQMLGTNAEKAPANEKHL